VFLIFFDDAKRCPSKELDLSGWNRDPKTADAKICVKGAAKICMRFVGEQTPSL